MLGFLNIEIGLEIFVSFFIEFCKNFRLGIVELCRVVDVLRFV